MAGVYRIGRAQFLEMAPSPQLVQAHTSIAVAASTDSISIYKDGIRGDPFQVSTTVDAKDARDAAFLIKYYSELTGSIQRVIWDGRIYGLYLVKAVRTNAVEILKLIGGIRAADPQYMVEAVWELIPFDNS